MIRKPHVGAVALAMAAGLTGCAFWPARAANSVPPATASSPSRYTVAAQVLPGQVSMTLLYVTDSQANKLYIYRAVGGMATDFKDDPELYRTYDLTSAGQKNLQQAK